MPSFSLPSTRSRRARGSLAAAAMCFFFVEAGSASAQARLVPADTPPAARTEAKPQAAASAPATDAVAVPPQEEGPLQPEAVLVEDNLALGTSRRRIRLGLDPVDGLTKTESWITALEYGAVSGQALFVGAANLHPRVALPLTAVTLAGSLTGAYFLTQRSPKLHGGVLAGLNLGMWAGLFNGAFLAGTIYGDRMHSMRQARVTYGITWGLSTLAAAGGALAAHRLGATTGDIGLLSTTTFFGASTGFLIKSVAYGSGNNRKDNRMVSGALLAGSAVGAGIGAAIVSKLDISRTRAFFLDLGGISGLGVGYALSQASPKTRGSNRAVAGFLLGGQLLGLATSALLTRALDAAIALPKDMHLQPAALPVQSRHGSGVSVVPGVELAAAF